MAEESFKSTRKALQFVKYFFPYAKVILLVTLTVGMVMRMSGIECLTSTGSATEGYKTPLVSSHIVEADGNYTSVVTSPATYNREYNNGPDKPLGAYIPAVTSKSPNAYGRWVNSKVKIDANQEFSINTGGKVSLCKAQKTRRDIKVDADLYHQLPHTTPLTPLTLPNATYPHIWEKPATPAIPAAGTEPARPASPAMRWVDSVQVSASETAGIIQLSEADSQIITDTDAGSIPINVNPGDSIDIRVNPLYDEAASPENLRANHNKWASEFAGTNPWNPKEPDRGSTADSIALDFPVSDAANNICTDARSVTPKRISYDDGKYYAPDGTTGQCNVSYGAVGCPSICQWCRDEEWVSDPGYPCWNVHGKGLKASIFMKRSAPGVVPEIYDETFINPEVVAVGMQPDFGMDLNVLMNPYTRVQNTTPGATPVDNSTLSAAQQKENYYGYYVHKVTQAGTLRFRIDTAMDAFPPTHPLPKSVGGYMVTVVITPSGCEAYDGSPEVDPLSTAYDPEVLTAGTPPEFEYMDDQRGRIQAKYVALPPPGAPILDTAETVAGTDLFEGIEDGILPITSFGSAGTVWFRVLDVDHEPNMPHTDPNWTYIENSGKYTAVLSTYQESGLISSMLLDLRNLIKPTIDDAVKNSFTKLVESVNFMKSLRALVTLYLVFFFVMFVMGIIEINQADFVTRIMKIVIVLGLLSPNSFDFFNNYFFLLFSDGRDILINALTGGLGDPDNPFAFLDKTVGQMVQKDNIVRVLALFMVYPIGWFFVILIMLGMWTYITAMAKAMLAYFTAMVLVAFLLMMAPFFIAFMLFPVTKSLFESWVKMLIRYTLEPVFLIVGLVILNEFVVIALHGIISHPACWKCAIPFDLGFLEDVFCFYFYLPWGYNASGSMLGLDFATQLFVSVFIFEITTRLAENYVQLSPRISATLTGTSALMGTNLTGSAGGMDSVGMGMTNSIGSAAEDVKRTAINFANKVKEGMNDQGGGGKGSDGGGGGAPSSLTNRSKSIIGNSGGGGSGSIGGSGGVDGDDDKGGGGGLLGGSGNLGSTDSSYSSGGGAKASGKPNPVSDLNLRGGGASPVGSGSSSPTGDGSPTPLSAAGSDLSSSSGDSKSANPFSLLGNTPTGSTTTGSAAPKSKVQRRGITDGNLTAPINAPSSAGNVAASVPPKLQKPLSKEEQARADHKAEFDKFMKESKEVSNNAMRNLKDILFTPLESNPTLDQDQVKELKDSIKIPDKEADDKLDGDKPKKPGDKPKDETD